MLAIVAIRIDYLYDAWAIDNLAGGASYDAKIALLWR